MANDQFSEINSKLDRVITVVVGLQQDMISVKSTLTEHSGKFEAVQTNLDWLVHTFRKLDQERVFGTANVDRLKADVESLKSRVQRLELSPQSA